MLEALARLNDLLPRMTSLHSLLLCLLLGGLLWGPADALARFRIKDLEEQGRSYLAVGFLLSLVWSLVAMVRLIGHRSSVSVVVVDSAPGCIASAFPRSCSHFSSVARRKRTTSISWTVS